MFLFGVPNIISLLLETLVHHSHATINAAQEKLETKA
jgi:hypothetical protein